MIDVPLLSLDSGLAAPAQIRTGDAAADLPSREDVLIGAGERVLVPTGFAIGLPVNTCGLVLSRSGLALKHGIAVLNAPGLIDSGYRGEIRVILLNTSSESYQIRRGDRIAQLLVLPTPAFALVAVDELPGAVDDRGSDGFGSSG